VNIYAVLLLVIAIGVFVYAVDMGEPFWFLSEQFTGLFIHIKTNNVMFNSVVLALVIALLVGIIRKLFAKNDSSLEEKIWDQIRKEQQQRNQQGQQ
jgi:uncharacterized membrane protein